MFTRVLDDEDYIGVIVVMQGLQIDGILQYLHRGERGVCPFLNGSGKGKPTCDDGCRTCGKYTYIYKVCFFHDGGDYKLNWTSFASGVVP